MKADETLTDDEVREAYLDGCEDDFIGFEGQEPKSIVRVGRYLLHTDSQGFEEIEEADTVEQAERFMEGVRNEEVGA